VFASAAVSSALASAIYEADGWGAVSILGAGLAGVGVLVWVVEQWRLRRGREGTDTAIQRLAS